jgi:signal transduction histidine kinase
LKSTTKIYAQWLFIGVFITLICVGVALSITHFLTERERVTQMELRRAQDPNRMHGPVRQRLEIIKSLTAKNILSVPEAYKLVDKAQLSPFPEASFLIDSQKNIVDAHYSKNFDKNKMTEFQNFALSPEYTLRVYITPFDKRMRPQGPPEGALYILGIVLSGSIAVGIGLSLFTLSFYQRRRAHQIAAVMDQLKSGDLKARFHVNQMDEAGLLMAKFNEMAAEIERLVTNLKEAESARTQLLQELAHDLRTPVASMKNFLETLFYHDEKLTTEKRKKLLSLAGNEVNYFEKLVEDLLFLSGVRELLESKRKSVSLKNLVQMELDILDNPAIRTELIANEDYEVDGDEHLLRRLVKNALTNAIRHASSRVVVTIRDDDANTFLSVQDDGKGLAPEELATFGDKKFSRKFSSENIDHISIGLGAVIMKKIITLHEGTMNIQNISPGAEVSFTIPRKN